MRIYACASPSHWGLAQGWLRSCAKDPMIEPVLSRIDIPSDGDYANAEWKGINEAGSLRMRSIFVANKGRIIGTSGVDVRYIRPFVSEIEGLMAGRDVLLQREYADGSLFNPDVAFWRCSWGLVSAWERWVALLGSWEGHLAGQNALMRQAFKGLRVGLLPVRYAATMNGGAELDPVLFHANWTPPPGSVGKKLAALAKYEVAS